jgi:hypothetical protein
MKNPDTCEFKSPCMFLVWRWTWLQTWPIRYRNPTPFCYRVYLIILRWLPPQMANWTYFSSSAVSFYTFHEAKWMYTLQTGFLFGKMGEKVSQKTLQCFIWIFSMKLNTDTKRLTKVEKNLSLKYYFPYFTCLKNTLSYPKKMVTDMKSSLYITVW